MMGVMFFSYSSAELWMTILLRTAIAEVARFEGAVLIFGSRTVVLELVVFATLWEFA